MNQVSEARRQPSATAGGDSTDIRLLGGVLGGKELEQLCEELSSGLQRGVRQVVVDFGDVAHLDYRGVKPLMARGEAFRRAGGDIKLSGLSAYVAAIFRAAGAH